MTIRLSNRDFAHWATASKEWKVSPGCYRVRVGSSSRDLPLDATVARGGADCGPDAVVVPGVGRQPVARALDDQVGPLVDDEVAGVGDQLDPHVVGEWLVARTGASG